ncbi:hypothetical protein [Roseimicrobium sp. ORNL1]|uniref:hypothetical protein n=1 Tax=Roseimicrobium sp. ORNL1 TaxID=2711231 RepID=UPI0013E1421F|nr:hypothetical protein [Roseimicrobium sp. ORNL1]QIF03612.1 hypothetical protein G5S37_19485 [Roseimicrobium sp. ORNL1]
MSSRSHLLVCASMLLSALSAHTPLSANPIAITHAVYIASEALTVEVGAEAAYIDGSFRFKSALKKGDFGEDSDIRITIPVWIPAKAPQGDTTVRSLLEVIELGESNKIEGPLASAWESAVGLKFTVAGRSIPIEVLRITDPMARKNRKYSPAARQHEGWILAFADVYFPPALLRGTPEIRIRYRQPLRKTKAGAEFLYLPEFGNLPKGATTTDLEKYAMKLQTKDGGTLAAGGVVIPSGHSARLPLAHHQPIKLLVTTP